MSYPAPVAALIDREHKLAEQELDAAQRYLDEVAERHAAAMHRVQQARARVIVLRECKQGASDIGSGC